jgi:hypothetical protein
MKRNISFPTMSAGAWVSAPISTAMFPWPSISKPVSSRKVRPGEMSALGHEQTLSGVRVMSALAPKADIRQCRWDVREVPIADIRRQPNGSPASHPISEGWNFEESALSSGECLSRSQTARLFTSKPLQFSRSGTCLSVLGLEKPRAGGCMGLLWFLLK